MTTDLTGKPEEGLDHSSGMPAGSMDRQESDQDSEKASPKKKQTRGEQEITAEELRLKEAQKIPRKISEVKKILEERVGLGVSFDVVLREMTFGGKHCAFFYMNGFAKDTALIEVIKRLSYVNEEETDGRTLQTFMDKLVVHIQVSRVETMDETIDKALAGMTALYIEGESAAIVMDAKNYPSRSTEEPDLERVVRGSRDGFVETLLINVTLIRRRLRDPKLKLELVQVGERTKSDVCLCYIEDIADTHLIESFKSKLQEVKTEGMPLAEKQLEEALVNTGWNPFPLVRYSERPDVVSAHLLDGHLVLMMDTSPSAMILPCSYFQLMQHAEEYRQTPMVGTYLRWVRFFGIMASLFLLPIWYLMVSHPELKPAGLEWIGPQKASHLPIIVQFLLAELGIDLMRMAAVHTPTPLATAMGLIAAILIGQIAVETGLFVNEVIMYLALATIGMFATPSYELGMANRISRLALLVVTAAFSVPGFVAGASLWILFLGLQRSYNSPYLWPFIPFNAKALFSMIVRRPFGSSPDRPSITRPKDNTRQPA